MNENKNEMIMELVNKLCISAVQDLWQLMSVDGYVTEYEIRNYLTDLDDYRRLKELINMHDDDLK